MSRWLVEESDYGEEWWLGGEGNGQLVVRTEDGRLIAIIPLDKEDEPEHVDRQRAIAKLIASMPEFIDDNSLQ